MNDEQKKSIIKNDMRIIKELRLERKKLLEEITYYRKEIWAFQKELNP